MAQFFEMPQASPTMEAGTILSWKKKEGEALKPQDVIAEVETDKAAMDIEVFDAGVLLKILAQEGEEVPAGRPIAIIGKDKGEDVAGLMSEFEKLKSAPAKKAEAPAKEEPTNGKAAAAPAPEEQAEAAPEPEKAPEAKKSPPRTQAPRTPSGPGLQPLEWMGKRLDPALMEAPGTYAPAGPVVRASPLARKIADEKGIDIARVQGTGPNGRVTRIDVETWQPGLLGRSHGGPRRADEKVRITQMRKSIAKRLTAVHTTAPTFFLTAVLECDNLVQLRTQLVAAGMKVSFNDILIKACAKALAESPQVNASWGDDGITRYGSVHVGVAVALDDGLITPVVKDADRKAIDEIAGEVRELAERARAMKLQPDEYTGSTFTISNLGMMGIEHFTAILNPPEACILAVGALTKEPVVAENGSVVVHNRMRVTLTCDHRVVDGATGAKFLQVVRKYVENPVLCLM